MKQGSKSTMRKLITITIMVMSMAMTACAETSNKDKSITVEGQQISYDKIHNDVSQLLNVKPNTKEVFIRWQLPIRYFVDGLEEYPEVARQLDEIAQQMVQLTGLDIKRHDKIYWPPEGSMYHPDSPEHHFTNVHFFFYPDFDSLVANSEYIKVAEVLGSSIEREKNEYNHMYNLSKNDARQISLTHYSGSNESLMYHKYFIQMSKTLEVLDAELIDTWLNVLSPSLPDSKENLSFSARGRTTYSSENLSIFDRLLLEAYYRQNETLKHGINNEQAAALIAEDIWQQYQALSEQTQ